MQFLASSGNVIPRFIKTVKFIICHQSQAVNKWLSFTRGKCNIWAQAKRIAVYILIAVSKILFLFNFSGYFSGCLLQLEALSLESSLSLIYSSSYAIKESKLLKALHINWNVSWQSGRDIPVLTFLSALSWKTALGLQTIISIIY